MGTYVAKKRPGRNDPCHCGSGKKYKGCCRGSDQNAESEARRRAAATRKLSKEEEALPDVQALRRKVEARQQKVRGQLARDYGIQLNFVSPIEWNGQKVWSIGNRVYADCPPNQTFHEFLLQLLRETLGAEWRAAQERAGPHAEHFLYRCFTEYGTWTTRLSEKQEPNAKGLWSALPNGWAQYLRSVAWDVASLIHATAADLPEPLIARLRDPAAFQGVRYEIAVAALFARLDCQIRFLDDDDLRDEKHPEFIATHRPSGQEFAVEAKSRHRSGVINQEGSFDGDDPLRGDARMVRRLFTKALEKNVNGLPYFIFIDINAPADPEAEGFDRDWQQGIKTWMDRFPVPTVEEPAKYNGLYVTNFSPQYEGDQIALPGEWLGVFPSFVVAPVISDLTASVVYALDRYDKVPEIGLDGEILRPQNA